MILKSFGFRDGESIPTRYTGDGVDFSPPMQWTGEPEGTRSFALICDDPDAPKSKDLEYPFVHWLIYNIAADCHSLPEGLGNLPRLDEPVQALQGLNSFGKKGYAGPLPPQGHGTHHYYFTLYALDDVLDLKPGVGRTVLMKEIEQHVLASAKIVGLYERRAERKSA